MVASSILARPTILSFEDIISGCILAIGLVSRSDMGTKKLQRLFFALWPSVAERSLLWKRVDSVISGNANIKITPIDNIHCTLAFLGDCDDVAVRCYAQAGESIVSEPLTISFDRIVFRKKQAMIWVTAYNTPDALESLNSRLQAAIAHCGHTPDEREFIPHVTVARKIKQSPVIGEWRPVEWNIDRLVLMCSHIDANGATYKPLGTWFFDLGQGG